MGINRNRQRGLTLVEILVALVIALGLTALAANMLQQDARRSRNDNSAEWLRIVASGARSYEGANRDALLASAGPSTPVTVTPAQLAPFLPTGFSTKSAHGQSFEVRFIEPVAGQLDGMVMTKGGDSLDGLDLNYIAGAAKGGAGFIDPTNAGQAKGPGGNWTRPLAAFGGGTGPGHLAYALFYDAATSLESGAYLSREAVTGKPELNRMNTAIDMANNNINNVGAVSANTVSGRLTHTGGYLTVGSYSSSYGTGAGRFWWNDNTKDMSLTAASGGRGSLILDDLSAAGSVDSASLQTGSASVSGALTAGTVTGDEVYSNGWFRTRGNGGWYSETYRGGWHMTDTSWIRAYNNKNVYTAGQLRGGTVRSQGRLYADEYIHLGQAASNGGSCGGTSNNGLLGRTSAGTVLSCVNGRWTEPGGIKDTTVAISSTSACGPSGFARAVCPAGYLMTGGGWQMTRWAPNNAYDARNQNPDHSYPSGNGWAVTAGGGTGYSCFAAYAVCAK